jgi:hypothetical protein
MTVYRVTLFQTYFAQSIQNVMHFDAGASVATEGAVAGIMLTDWIPNVKKLQNARLRYTNIAVKSMAGGPTSTHNFACDVVGASFDLEYSLTFPALILHIATANGSRKGRGRVYIAGLPGAGYNEGRYNAGTQGAINVVTADLVAAFVNPASTDLRLGVQGREDEPSFIFATDILPRSIPGVQRRRNIGTGI